MRKLNYREEQKEAWEYYRGLRDNVSMKWRKGARNEEKRLYEVFKNQIGKSWLLLNVEVMQRGEIRDIWKQIWQISFWVKFISLATVSLPAVSNLLKTTNSSQFLESARSELILCIPLSFSLGFRFLAQWGLGRGISSFLSSASCHWGWCVWQRLQKLGGKLISDLQRSLTRVSPPET